LGIGPQVLFQILSSASGRCWAATDYCPAPGPVPGSPANREYAAGLSAGAILGQLKLAQQVARTTGAKAPISAAAAALYGLYVEQGGAATDFSGIFRFLRGPEKASTPVSEDETAPAQDIANR
jgi:3-hydroxyisobutyrate dehydrogenase